MIRPGELVPGPPRNGPSPRPPCSAGFTEATSKFWAIAAPAKSKRGAKRIYEEHTTTIFVKSMWEAAKGHSPRRR